MINFHHPIDELVAHVQLHCHEGQGIAANFHCRLNFPLQVMNAFAS